MIRIAHARFAGFIGFIGFIGVVSALTLSCNPAFSADSLTAGQLAAADRVFVGTASCDANQQVTVAAVPGLPGHFVLTHQKTVARLVTQETTSGAVRLEDAKLGLLWIQIPAKSMLMNTKLGRRVVDGCITPEQALASRTPDPTQPVVLDWGQPDPIDY